MQTAGEFYGTFNNGDKQLLVRIRGLLERLPNRGHIDRNGDHLWSCHDICFGIHRYLDLDDRGWEVVQGLYIRYDHCWLYRPSRGTILDVYPVASLGGPIMVDTAAVGLALLYNKSVQRDTPARARARRELSVVVSLLAQIDNDMIIDLQAVDMTPSSRPDTPDQLG